MTAPARTIAAKFTAQGSEAVTAAVRRVSDAATRASERVVETSRVQAQRYQLNLQAAERAAHAEERMRQDMAARAIQTTERVAAAQQQAMVRTASVIQGRAASAARGVAVSIDQIASTGQATGAVMRKVVTDAASFALMFGAGGPIVAAVGIATLAIVNLFSRQREEMRKTRAEFERTQRVILAGNDYAGAGRAVTTLLAGDPSSDIESRQLGVLRLRERINEERARLEAMAATASRLAVQDAGRALRGLEADLARMDAELAAAQQTFNTVAARRTEILRTVADREAAEAAAKRGPTYERFYKRGPTRSTPDLTAAGAGADAALAPALDALRNPLGDPATFAKQLNDDLRKSFDLVQTDMEKELAMRFRSLQTPISNGIADALVAGIAGGIAAAIATGSIGQALQGLGSVVLAGLGNMFADIAATAIKQATLMLKFEAWLTANPVAALAVAASMMLLARSIGGRPRQSVGAVGGFGGVSTAASAGQDSVTRLIFGGQSVGRAVGLTPMNPMQFMIVGPNDPTAQRAIAEIVRKAGGRNL